MSSASSISSAASAPNAQAGSTIITEGKTKIVFADPTDPSSVVIHSKRDITAGDGAKHDVISGKDIWANQTTCNVFNLLRLCGIPVAFREKVSRVAFRAQLCTMFPYEVVVRREAHGSYIKRMPEIPRGRIFPKLLVEFFLKTKDKRWKNHKLPCDDPLMEYVPRSEFIELYEQSKPIADQSSFLILPPRDVFSVPDEAALFKPMAECAARAFMILEKAWQLEGGRLVDFKVEFGLDSDGTLRLADVIDNDSWRVLENGAHISKQLYRDGSSLEKVAKEYARVNRITDRFHLPKQQVVVWAGSGATTTVVDSAVRGLFDFCNRINSKIACSSTDLIQFIQENPNTVVIACGQPDPTNFASVQTVAPVVPMSPSAVLDAIRILALNNPLLYMRLQHNFESELKKTLKT